MARVRYTEDEINYILKTVNKAKTQQKGFSIASRKLKRPPKSIGQVYYRKRKELNNTPGEIITKHVEVIPESVVPVEVMTPLEDELLITYFSRSSKDDVVKILLQEMSSQAKRDLLKNNL